MKPSSLDRIRIQMNQVNALELKAREEYFEYLSKRGDKSQSREQILASASLAEFGKPAPVLDIENLQSISASKLPDELIHFYRTQGSLNGGSRLHSLVIHSAESLFESSARAAAPWKRIRSIGLVDMIIKSWGGDRFEFDPSSGDGLTDEEVAVLNARYSIVGWFDVAEGEGIKYLYFDDRGKFGTLFFHQEYFDEFYSEYLKPMLQASSAEMTFNEALATFVESAAAPGEIEVVD